LAGTSSGCGDTSRTNCTIRLAMPWGSIRTDNLPPNRSTDRSRAAPSPEPAAQPCSSGFGRRTEPINARSLAPKSR
jgi:hypothetical protein